MMLWLGNIMLGVPTGSGAITGPTALSETWENSYARHDVIRGKPIVQVIGEELDVREFTFFFDERFCDPETQWLRLMDAYRAKTALPLLMGTAYDGRPFVVERLGRDVQKTSSSGRVVRLESTLSLVEAPIPDPLADAFARAIGGAQGLGSSSAKPEALK